MKIKLRYLFPKDIKGIWQIKSAISYILDESLNQNSNTRNREHRGYSWYNRHLDKEIEISDNVLEILAKVNLEIKNLNVESRYKNKFYKYKEKFLKSLLIRSKINKIIDSGEYWKFIIEGYSFHQIKGNYKNYKITASEFEKYKPDHSNLPEFSLEDYKLCLLTLIHRIWTKTL